MDLALSAEHRRFRADVRAFLHERLTPEIREAVRRQTATWVEKDTMLAWQAILDERGWLAYNWPKEHGGTGWDPLQQLLFEWECARAGAPELVAMGLRYVGPVIIEFGSDAQKRRFLPKILSGEHYWAQGFSEPGAGSDLAGVKCRAEPDGADYVVNGTKLWTTHAHFANWAFCLVRTSAESQRQAGISFLLIDLTLPGVSIDPIPTAGVDREVNSVFFEDVRVPADCLVGEPGRGWDYAKFLLANERGGATFAGRLRRELSQVEAVIDAGGTGERFARRAAALAVRLLALEMLELRIFTARQHGGDSGSTASVLKLAATELQQAITELGLEAAGPAGLDFVTARPLYGAGAPGLLYDEAVTVAASRYLNLRAATIYGGSSEIQREIIAREVLRP